MSLADEITSKAGSAATATPGKKGQFDVVADGELVFSKEAEGRWPEDGEIVAMLSGA